MAGKTNGAHSVDTDWARAPPKIDSFWRRCGNVFYNPEENSCFGRTPKRWGKFKYLVTSTLIPICIKYVQLYTLQVLSCVLHIPLHTATSRQIIGNNLFSF